MNLSSQPVVHRSPIPPEYMNPTLQITAVYYVMSNILRTLNDWFTFRVQIKCVCQTDPSRSVPVFSCDLVCAEIKEKTFHPPRWTPCDGESARWETEMHQKKKKSVRLRRCRLCRQLTVSQPSHRECAERELRFDHLSGLTDSVCTSCVYVVCVRRVLVFVTLKGAEESVN